MSISAVVFDMDGVLIDAKDWHYEALNEALSIFTSPITREDHLANFDGLPTKVKLAKLEKRGRLPRRLFDIVEDVKQERTLRMAAQFCRPRVEHLILMGWLKSRGLKLAVATNSIRMTSETMLTWAGVRDSLDLVLTNEDVARPKPDPEIYLKATELLQLEPHQCLVVEDNENGVAAATQAGCQVLVVDSPADLTVEFISSRVR